LVVIDIQGGEWSAKEGNVPRRRHGRFSGEPGSHAPLAQIYSAPPLVPAATRRTRIQCSTLNSLSNRCSPSGS